MGYGVVRARGGLGVILDPEDRQFLVAKPLDGAVVEVDMRDLEIGRAGNPLLAPLYGEAVVLARDQHITALEILHGMIPAAVSIREFLRATAECDPEELVPEADAEHRHTLLGDRLDRRWGVLDRLGVPWTVREEDAVRLVREDLLRRRRRG